jgi:L-amino acid N-acyltransferase YncA
MIHIRRAGQLDCAPMAELLNEIIARGGTTVMTEPITRDAVAGRMATAPERSAWHLAEDDAGAVLGFQWIAPHGDLPSGACDIATFVETGRRQIGIGSRLFLATQSAARDMGYAWINATIRADNAGGLAYYRSRGFEHYDQDTGVRLQNGLLVDRLHTRFDL